MTNLVFVFLLLLFCICSSATAAEMDSGRVLIKKRQWTEAESFYAARLIEFAEAKDVKSIAQLNNLVLWYDIARYFGQMDAMDVPALMAWFCRQTDFTATLLRAFREQDSPKRAFRVLAQLRRKFGESDVMRFPGLAIAHALVWDTEPPYSSKFDVCDSFGYYLTNSHRMLFDVTQLPYQAAIFLACAEATPAERVWALGKMMNTEQMTSVYNWPEYDWECLLGKPKKIKFHEYTLPNILKYGGICGDRAYFAANVARASGVPAIRIVGQGIRGGHEWTGYIQAIENNRYIWNLGCGRYEFDRYYIGVTRDPQTGQMVYDYQIAMRTRECELSADKVRAANSWVCLAGVLASAKKHDLAKWALEQALKINRFNLAAWAHVCRMCKSGILGEEYADEIMDAALKTFPDEPDFCYGVFTSVVDTIPKEQFVRRSRWYRQAAALFRTRPDLTVAVGRAYGDYLWEMGKEAQAYSVYHETIRTYMDDPRLVVDMAIKVSERQQSGDELGKSVALLKSLIRRCRRPAYTDRHAPHYPWYRLQVCLKGVYEKMGDQKGIAEVESELGKFKKR